MSNNRDFYIVSYDGTILEPENCVVVHLTKEQLLSLEDVSDSQIYAKAIELNGKTDTVADLIMDDIMKSAPV